MVTNKFKLDLFNFNKNLIDESQIPIANIVNQHLNACDFYSEKEIYEMLNANLKGYGYDPSVRNLLEKLENELYSSDKKMNLTYSLKDLYKKLERNNNSCILRQPLKVVLEIINLNNDQERMEYIMNELKVYDYEPLIKHFLISLATNPMERVNMENVGKAEKMVAFLEKVDNTKLVYLLNRWFVLENDSINYAGNIAEFVKNEERRRQLFTIEKVLQHGEFVNDCIYFRAGETLKIGLHLETKAVYLNDEKMPKETKLDDVFNTPIIEDVIVKKNLYVLLKEAYNNLDNFVEMDNAMKITSITKINGVCAVINLNEKCYLYEVQGYGDTNYNMSAYNDNLTEYKNVVGLIADIKNNWDYDISDFYKGRLSEDQKMKKTLEDKEKTIQSKIAEINEEIQRIEVEEKSKINKEDFDFIMESLDAAKLSFVKDLHEVKKQRIELLTKMSK